MPFDLDAFLAHYPPPARVGAPPPRPGMAQKRRGGRGDPAQLSDADFASKCARAYAAKFPGAVEGSGGHVEAFKLACVLVKGFDLEQDEALSIISEWSEKCSPPWTATELEHKINSADTKADDKARGWLVPARGRPARIIQQMLNGAAENGATPNPLPFGQYDLPIERQPITVTEDEYITIAQVITAVAANPSLYQRENMLFTVDRAESDDKKRVPTTPFLRILSPSRLRTMITEYAELYQIRRDKHGDPYEDRAHPPEWLVAGVHGNQSYTGIPMIKAVIESPILKPDGTCLTTPGYDHETKILYEPNADFPLPSENPTHDEALESYANISDIVCDFPFKSPLHMASWLCSLLTQFGRFAIDGPCPLFLVDANIRGSGKTRLCDIVSLIVSGRKMARTSCPSTEDEWRKQITSIMLAGDRQVLLDNISGSIGSSALDGALTSTHWQDRLLGKSQIVSGELNVIWYATGNNLSFRGDISRRVIPCRLVSDSENPEKREGFKHEEIEKYVLENRPSFVRDCLTILRAYQVAGRPKVTRYRLGSYEAWSDVVRSTVLWLTGFDAADAQGEFAEQDPQAGFREAFITGWAELTSQHEDGLTAAMAVAILKSSPSSKYHLLKDILMRSSDTSDLPSPQKLGYKLRDLRDQVIGGKRLVSDDGSQTSGMPRWRVEEIDPDSLPFGR